MADKITICNMALRKIGLEAITTLDSPFTNQRQRDCDLYYPQAVDTVLRVAPWSFARKRRRLTLFTVPEEYEGIAAYSYMYPVDSIKFLRLTAAHSKKPEHYDIMRVDTQEKIVFTNIQYAYGVYTCADPNTSWFDVDFVEAVALRLAAYLAGPLRSDDAKVVLAANQYAGAVAQAQKNNILEEYREPDKSDTWISSRG